MFNKKKKPMGRENCRLIYTKEKTYHVSYVYENRQKQSIELWLSLPLESKIQRNIQYQVLSSPLTQTKSEYANQIAYYKLLPNEKVQLEYSFDSYSSKLVTRTDQIDSSKDLDQSETSDEVPETLSAVEREYYLRSTHLSPINDSIVNEAHNIVQGEKDPIRQANLLFKNLLKKYKYKYPLKERGAMHMLSNKTGDCGEFSFLFTSWCRSLGIPCRSLVGSWTAGSTNPHVWNEFYVEGIGWIPVDSSVAVLNKSIVQGFGLLLSYGTVTQANYYFGNIEGKRIAFSQDANILLRPDFIMKEAPKKYKLYKFAEYDFAWGFHSQDGTAPYLQPIYLRFEEFPSKQKTEDFIGKWRIKEPFFPEIIRRIRLLSFVIWFILLAVELSFYFMKNVSILLETLIVNIRGLLLIIFCTASIYRKESNIFVYLLFITSFFYVISIVRTLVS